MKMKKDAGDEGGCDSDSDLDDPLNMIPQDEIDMVDDFLSCFIIEGSAKEDMIDIKHAIKGFPGRIDEHNVFRCQG